MKKRGRPPANEHEEGERERERRDSVNRIFVRNRHREVEVGKEKKNSRIRAGTKGDNGRRRRKRGETIEQ